SCTDRCHVNSLSYRNDFEGEVFQHVTHTPAQAMNRSGSGQGWGLHCVDCHEDKEVHREGHGRLTIDKEACLGCHHVDNKNESCSRCHKNIDARPMDYNGRPFVHGFTADSDFNCKECHLADPRSSMREGINCQKCHHTRPRMACLGCHEEALKEVYYPRPAEMNHLGWTTGFLHSQHPDTRLSCQECHPPREDRAKGVGEYQAHCGQCHHKEKPALSPPKANDGADCQECHQVVFQFFSGKLPVEGIESIPDKMSRAVRCEDCHKPLKGGGGFSEVGDECARCHNKHYAELLEAQRDVISSWVDRLRKPLALSALAGATVRSPLLLPEDRPEGLSLLDIVEYYGLHNFSYSRKILSLLEVGARPTQDMTDLQHTMPLQGPP
ncbi:MAG: hypothetical protein ACK4WF_00955, partial [Candidatus Brocadiales bacterium]